MTTSTPHKSMLCSWLLLSLAGVVASWSSLQSGQPELFYCVPSLLAAVMLLWIRRQPAYYAQSFYRLVWQLSVLLLILALLPGCYLQLQQF